MRKYPVSLRFLGSSLAAVTLLVATGASAAERPLSGQAYRIADEAYKAFAQGEYDVAAAKAREAIRLRPDVARLRDLLQKAELARRTMQAQLAFNASAASYQALERRDFAQAVELARKAVDYLPAVPAFRIALINALVAAGELEQAEQAASDMIKPDTSSSEALLLRGAIRQQRGAVESAQTDFDQALSSAGPAAQRGIRLVAADAALANGDPQRALRLLEPLQGREDKEAAARRALATIMRGRSGTSHAALAFSFPLVSCTSGPDLVSACDINPGATSADPGFMLADQAYRAFADKNYALASSKAGEATQLSPRDLSYRRLQVQALSAQGSLAEAEQAANAALADFGNDADMLLARADIRKRRGNLDAAQADYAAVLSAPDKTTRTEISALIGLGRKEDARARLAAAASSPEKGSELELAYLALQAGDNQDALELFNRAEAQGTLTDAARHDAAYTAARQGRNEQAIGYLNRTVDAAQAGRLTLDAQQVYDVRRESADLERRWGMRATLSDRGVAAAGIGVPRGGTIDGKDIAAEVYWRPFGLQNGALVEVYGRVNETLSGGSGVPTGSATAQAALGARVKPFSEVNAILALERLVPLGDATSGDWLARAGFSSDAGLDLHAEQTSWLSTHVYAEAGHYFQHPQSYATLEGQLGRSYRLGESGSTLVLFPHLVMGADYDSGLIEHDKKAIGSGIGTNMRYWFRQDYYNAPRSYFDLSLQYRWRIAGDKRAEGWFIRLSASY
ncbi:tetratricopeptide repeat protein [Collimonas sp. OK412]|jgi:tetratricopeptide (TPR) repeat protein|uniref:NfrA family protein n=1 Tax=Collimonas sp. (strain OK412) TaxID=1801619 RepID=UPI0008EDAFC3|nr:tetratricopeptide repeat protein [Collimonas sp. OK412]SFD16222.1 Tetratricopeptide repeat-containing protein [Collimonas sp. OK412]